MVEYICHNKVDFMRLFITFLLTLFLALPAAWTGDLSLLYAGQPASEETAHACCHREAPDCSIGVAAYCCQSQVPVAPVPVAQALPPAPSASLALLTPDLPVIEQLTGDPLVGCFAPVPLTAPPPALYQLHRAYRI